MKALKKSKVTTGFFGLLFLLTLSTKAQICPGHTIFNNCSCAVDVTYKIFDGMSPTCAIVCSGTVNIPASGSFSIPLACTPSGNEDIELIVQYPPVGTGTLTTSVNFGLGPFGGGPWPCYGPATMSYFGAGPIACTPNFLYTVSVTSCFATQIF